MVVQGQDIGKALDDFVQTRSRWVIDLIGARGYELLTSFDDPERRSLFQELDGLQHRCTNFFYGAIHDYGSGSRWHTLGLGLSHSLYYNMTLVSQFGSKHFIPLTTCTDADMERSFAAYPPESNITAWNTSTINYKSLGPDAYDLMKNLYIIKPEYEHKGHFWTGVSRVYLMTDDESVIRSSKDFPDFHFDYMDMPRSNQGWLEDIEAGMSRDKQEEAFLVDLYSATRCNNATETTVQHVSDCYKSIGFNSLHATTTLDSLYSLYNDFFIFRDAALTPDLALPFTSKPVDVLAELEKIRQTEYTSDFDFHSDLTALAHSLNDKHVSYARHNVTECDVLEINGQGASSYIQTWADKNTGFSKDAGVRLQDSMRQYTFTDQASFIQNICLAAPRPQPSHDVAENKLDPRYLPPMTESEALSLHRRELHPQEYVEKQKSVITRRADRETAPSLPDLPDAVFVAGAVTAAYQLKSKPNVGVLVVPTMGVEIAVEVLAVQDHLTALAERNVTHIIIDTSGNGGGNIAFASLLVDIFFPTTDKRINSHRARFRYSPAASALATAELEHPATTQRTYFYPPAFVNKTTGLPYTTNHFLNPVELTVNDRVAAYTDELYIHYDLSILNETVTYPWTNNVSKIVILTDGQCGSACGMASEHFVREHGVKAVAVGGHVDKELSMFSFAGAAVLSLNDIADAFEKLSVPPNLARLPYKTTVNIAVIEVYSGNDAIPLEYNSERYVAALRLDYTPETARNHDLLWGAVSDTAWS
ncbi:hypothetical protein BGZ67_005423 [Mortierella alpina]|nr:hypothetical protein BGZ67_005423 [Mortierella alpina]